MDFKGITWIENIYQQFEAACLEVEETMYQDTVKYVEDKVQTVGENVKRFYSDVMNDLSPESIIDPEKVTAPELSVTPYDYADIHKKPKGIISEVPMKVDKGLPENHEAAFDLVGRIQPQASVEVRECDFAEENINNDVVDANVIVHASTGCPASDSMLSVESPGKMGTEFWHTSCDGLSSESIGSNDDCITDVIEDDDIIEPGMATIEQFDKLNLEETCVMVDHENLCFVSNKEDNPKSYKKKIREALSSKMQLTRKQEYEQLAARYGDIDTGLEQKHAKSVIPSLAMDSETKLSSTHDFCESGWELL